MHDRLFSNGHRNCLFALLCAALLLPAVLSGLVEASDRTYPPDEDIIRDMGMAQTIRSGRFGADPLYVGEIAWYPPLVPALVALLAASTGLPIVAIVTRGGIVLNLIAVLAFAIMTWKILGRRSALFALASFVYFAGSGIGAWADVGLSSSLFVNTFMQGVFCLGLLVASHCITGLTESIRSWALGGFVTGLTFLGHPAGGSLLLILFMAIAVGGSPVSRPNIRMTTRRCVALLVTAVPVVALMVYPLLARYHLKMLNPYPSSYMDDRVSILQLPAMFAASPKVPLLLALISCVALARHYRRTCVLFLVPLVAALALFFVSGYGALYFSEHERLLWPAFVPAHHFFYYSKLFVAILSGDGLRRLVDVAARTTTVARAMEWLNRLRAVRELGRLQSSSRYVAVVLVGLMCCVPVLWACGANVQLSQVMRNMTGEYVADPMLRDHQFIQSSTSQDDVFLADDWFGKNLVAGTGRKLVASEKWFSNPYVDLVPRQAERDAMLKSLIDGDVRTFTALSSKYGVTRILRRSDEPFAEAAFPNVDVVYRRDTVAIYRVGR